MLHPLKCFQRTCDIKHLHIIFIPIFQMRLHIHTPRMFSYQTQFCHKIQSSIIFFIQFSFSNPICIQIRDNSIFSHTKWFTAISINPSITYFRRNNWELVFHSIKFLGYFIERNCYQTCIRISFMQVCINSLHFFYRMRTMIITRKINRYGSFPIW